MVATIRASDVNLAPAGTKKSLMDVLNFSGALKVLDEDDTMVN